MVKFLQKNLCKNFFYEKKLPFFLQKKPQKSRFLNLKKQLNLNIIFY